MSEHLDENAVAALFEQRAAPDAVAEVDRHVASCPPCRELLARYAALFAGNGTLGPTVATPPPVPTPPEGTPQVSADATPSAIIEWVERHGPRRRVGSVLRDKWRLDSLIGSGGMGHVYAATHRNGRRGAVKLLRAELASLPEAVDRFLREGYVANRLQHPGAVAILDDDHAEDGAPFLVMELLEGETVGERLQREGRLPVLDVLSLTDSVLDVLAVAHAEGIIHRDLKPDNLFVTTDGTLKLLDFGIARVLEASRALGGTQAGTTMGTPQFMPPEQARGEWAAVDARSDLWAVGATMYTLLTGLPVRDAQTPNLALLAAMTEPVPALREVAPSLSAALSAVVDKALALDQNARFRDARAMQGAVRAAREHIALGHGGTMLLLPDAVTATDHTPLRPGFSPPPGGVAKKLLFAVLGAGVGIGALAYLAASHERRAETTTTTAAAIAPLPAPLAEPVVPVAVDPPKTAEPAPAKIAAPPPRATTPAPLRGARRAPAGAAGPPSAPTVVPATEPLDVRR